MSHPFLTLRDKKIQRLLAVHGNFNMVSDTRFFKNPAVKIVVGFIVVDKQWANRTT
ncbi:MAG: hypothetical protein ACOYNC_02150 [Bacteroidales bacterium]